MDFPILKYVDVLVGLSLVMVLASTVVLAITQTLLNATSARSRHLCRGLVRLIRQIHPEGLRDHAEYLAALIVRHPLIARQTISSLLKKGFAKLTIERHVLPSKFPGSAKFTQKLTWLGRRMMGRNVLPPMVAGAVVQRDELTYMLIELAAGEGPLMDPLDDGFTPQQVTVAQTALADALRLNGIEDPAATLRAIRIKIVENERANPSEPAHRWRTDALLDAAPGDFTGKVHQMFDNTMARVSDGFGIESQIWVTILALIVAAAMQLDSAALIRRLSVDEKYRTALVEHAKALDAEQQKAAAAQKANPEDKAAAEQAQSITENLDTARSAISQLDSPALNLLPPTFGFPERTKWAGVLLTWVLLCLGAPFWFDMLKNALKLRTLLAKKDDGERKDREDTNTPRKAGGVAPSGTSSAPDDGSEAGDLSATGALG